MKDSANGLRFPPRLSISIGILALTTLAFGLVDAPAAMGEDTKAESGNPELAELYKGDQNDRSGDMHEIDWSLVSERDAQRRQRVLEIVEAGEARDAVDYYHAAMVFQHGEGIRDIRWARDWAKKSVELEPDTSSKLYKRAKWLVAAATDRHLHRQGKAQIFGTQVVRNPNGGPWTMEPFDRQAITDQERSDHGVSSIAEQEARLVTMNETLRHKGMLESTEAASDASGPETKRQR